jgi:hypothetical protein
VAGGHAAAADRGGGSDADAPTTELSSEASNLSEVTSLRYELVIEFTAVTIPYYFEQRGEVVLPVREHSTRS